jgi:hypothetical protein
MVIGPRDKCMKVKPLDESRRADLSKSRSKQRMSIVNTNRWCKIHNSGENHFGSCGWEGNHITKDLRAEEDLGHHFPEGRVAEIYAVRGKTLQEKVKETKLSFEIPESQRAKGVEDL